MSKLYSNSKVGNKTAVFSGMHASNRPQAAGMPCRLNPVQRKRYRNAVPTSVLARRR